MTESQITSLIILCLRRRISNWNVLRLVGESPEGETVRSNSMNFQKTTRCATNLSRGNS